MLWAAAQYNTGKYRRERRERFPPGEIRKRERFKHQLRLHLEHKQLKLQHPLRRTEKKELERHRMSASSVLHLSMSEARRIFNSEAISFFGFFGFCNNSCTTEVEEQWEKRRNVATVEALSFPFSKMHGFKCARCSAAYIRPAADPETRGCEDTNKTWPFLQSAAVGLITLHT